MAITFTPGLAAMSPEEKAAEYNNLLGSGFTDAQIREAANANFGVQSDDAWSSITGLASSLNSSNNSSSAGALSQANAAAAPASTATSSGALAQAQDQAAALTNPLNSMSSVDNVALAQGFQPTTIPGVENTHAKITSQILDQGTTDKWSGEGFGSAQKNAEDMARILTSIGITDISQFGQIDVPSNEAVTPVYEYVNEGYGESAQTTSRIVGYKDSKGNDVDPSLVRQVSYGGLGGGDTGDYSVAYEAPIGTQKAYGNKVTGQVVPNTYGERQTDNAFGGTYAGDGNTGYRVDFSTGKPIFYTTEQSSNSWGDISPFLAIASFVPGVAPFAMAANAAGNLANGNVLGAVLSGLGAYGASIGSDIAALQAAEASGDIINAGQLLDLQNTAANIKLGTTAIGGAAALDRGDLVGVVNAGLSGANQLGVKLPSGVTTGVQVGNVVTSLQNGNGAGALNALGDLMGSPDVKTGAAALGLIQAISSDNPDISAVANAAQNLSSAVAKSTSTGGNGDAGSDAFLAAKRAGASDADAMAASKELTRVAEENETFDGSSFDNQKDAMNAAIAEGLDKFTFGGKTFTIDNSAAQIADLEKTVRDEATERGNTTAEWGNIAGAQKDAAARNTVVIGNDEANDLTEAAALAKLRDPSATSFTIGGKTYNMSASDDQLRAIATQNDISSAPTFNDAFAIARDQLGANKTFTWNGKEYSTATAAERPDLSAPKAQAATDESAAETARLNRLNNDLVTGNAPNQSAAETTRLANLNAGLKSMEKTGFLGQIYKDLNEQFRLQGVAANEYLANNPDSPITNNISTAFEAAGNLQKNVAGGVALLLDNKPLSDALVKGGDDLTRLGQSIGTGPQDTKNWNDTLGLIDKAKGFEKLAVMAGRIMDGTSGLGRQVEVELRQELPGLFLGGGSVKGIMLATGAMDTAETAGNAALDVYDAAVKNGKTHADALSEARTAGAVAGATEAAVQLTLGKLADFGAGKISNVAGKAGTKVVGEGIVEGGQEGGAAAAVDLALGNELDANKYLTQTVVGGAVGKGAATATSGVDAAQTDALNSTASGATTAGSATSNLGSVGSVVPGADVVQGTDLGAIGSVTPGGDVTSGAETTAGAAGDTGATSIADITNNVTTQIGAGADASVVVGDTVASAIGAGSNANSVINSTVTSSINAGADASTVVGSAITSAVNAGSEASTVVSSSVAAAVNAGADASTVVGSAVTSAVTAGANTSNVVTSSVTAAVTAGADASTVVGSAVTSAVAAGANVDTSVASSVSASIAAGANANTAVTAAVDAAIASGNNVTVASNANTTTVTNATTNTTTTVNNNTGVTTTVNANTNVTTAVDANTNTTTTVDANTNITTQTTVNPNTNTQTNVVADVNANTNTQTTVNPATNTTVSTTVDANTNVTTQTTTDTNTQTTVVTDVNANTQTTVKVNVNTGDVIEEKETVIPDDWTPTVIETPVIPVDDGSATTATASTSTEKTSTTPVAAARLSSSGSGSMVSGATGLPSTFDIDPASLGSKVTQGRIDPLAQVKEAQAELERSVMMNQLDPRLLGVIQQRMDPQQQAQQAKQYDKDMGALEKILRGDSPDPSRPEAPASNEGKYYSYGSEDSIDDILGGKAANYKEGGFVEPLKASGGSMALPLLAKSGGALGKYNGREDFKDGKHVAGDGDGQSDDIPAWLADGEFVFPADVVSALGNGSTKAGTDKLYAMMHGIRDRARSKGPKDLPPPALKSPLDYLKSSKRSSK